MKFMCFGGAAAVVADDEAALAAAASRHHQRQRRSSLASSFRRKFLPGTDKNGDKSKKKTTKPSSPTKKKAPRVADAFSVFGGASIMTSSSVPSSAPLSSADSTASSLSSSCPSSVSASSSVLRALPSPPRSTPKRQAAAVVLCLLTVVLCGRVGATLLTSAALYLLPLRRGHPAARRDVVAEESSVAADYDAVSSASVSDAEEDTTAKRKRQVVRMGSAVLWRNRKQ